MSISTMAIDFQQVKVNGHWWIWMSRGGQKIAPLSVELDAKRIIWLL